MKKVILVNSYYFPDIIGGAEISTQLLAQGLNKHFDVHVVVTGSHKRGIIREIVNGVKVYRLPILNIYSPLVSSNISNIKKLNWHLVNSCNPIKGILLKKLLQEIKPDIINTQNLMGIGTFIWKIAKDLSIPVIHTTRDYALINPVNNSFVNKFIHKINVKRSKNVNYVVGISNFILRKHIDESLFKKAKKITIGNVVDSKRRERTEVDANSPITIGYFGQISSNKGVETLISAIKDIDAATVKEIIICGSGELLSKIKKLAENDRRIVLKGKLTPDKVAQQMARVDLTIVPSIWEEPFGRVIIESFQQGTPVLASDVGGIPELIDDKKMLFEKQNVKELREKIIRFKRLSYQDRNKLIKNSYDESEKYRTNIEDYVKIYSEFIN